MKIVLKAQMRSSGKSSLFVVVFIIFITTACHFYLAYDPLDKICVKNTPETNISLCELRILTMLIYE